MGIDNQSQRVIKAVLIGAAGYVAPRHMSAMRDLGIDLIAVLDPHDNVGVLDSYFPGCELFLTENDFADWCYCRSIDLVSICSPNHLHLKHIKMAFSFGADVICEKPLTLSTEAYDCAKQGVINNRSSLFCMLQFREHPIVEMLKREVERQRPQVVDICYIAPRGKWYGKSWKGDYVKSGGLLYNIGVHMFDLIVYLFDDEPEIRKVSGTQTCCIGSVIMGSTTVNWYLTTAWTKYPARTIAFDKKPAVELSMSRDLHLAVYRKIFKGQGDEYDCVNNRSIYRGVKLISKIDNAHMRYWSR